jgi:RNA polymerase sigma-70 factor (ECF subfamily)
VDANTERLTTSVATTAGFDFAGLFRREYQRIANVIVRIIGDPARAEELAVEAFCRLWRKPGAHDVAAGGWLHRTAIRLALDELRRRSRRRKYEQLSSIFGLNSTPEQIHLQTEKQRQVREILSRLKPRDAELLLLRSDGLSYQEIAAALDLNPSSVGKLVSRAQETFRKGYTQRYGH